MLLTKLNYKSKLWLFEIKVLTFFKVCHEHLSNFSKMYNITKCTQE